jgi:hypothetical protein
MLEIKQEVFDVGICVGRELLPLAAVLSVWKTWGSFQE